MFDLPTWTNGGGLLMTLVAMVPWAVWGMARMNATRAADVDPHRDALEQGIDEAAESGPIPMPPQSVETTAWDRWAEEAIRQGQSWQWQQPTFGALNNNEEGKLR